MKSLQHKVSKTWIDNMLRESSLDEENDALWGDFVVYRISLESSHFGSDGSRKIEVIEKTLIETEPRVLSWSMAWAYVRKFSSMNPGELYDMESAGSWNIARVDT